LIQTRTGAMPAHSASEDARERAYDAGIHVFLHFGPQRRGCPAQGRAWRTGKPFNL